MTYSFARCDNRLEAEDFDPSYRDASFFGSTAGSFLKHAPWVNNLMQALPDSVARLLHPAMASFIAQKRVQNSSYLVFFNRQTIELTRNRIHLPKSRPLHLATTENTKTSHIPQFFTQSSIPNSPRPRSPSSASQTMPKSS